MRVEFERRSESRNTIVGDMYHIDNIVTTEVRKRMAGLLERGRQRHAIACEMKRSTPCLLVRMLLSPGCNSLRLIVSDISCQRVTRTSLSGKEIDNWRSETR